MKIQQETDRKGRTYEFVAGDPLMTRIYTLANGLKVYLSPNDRIPEIQVYVGVKAGSDNDPLDRTGLAHYLEHLMFKGTKKVGTVDYEREKPLLDRIEALFEEYGRTADPEERKKIYAEIDRISNEASGLAVAQESMKLFQGMGATGMNAATSNYRTYFECVIPSGELRRWAMLESDRFMNPVFRGFHTELETVYEEFNERFSNDSLLSENIIDVLGKTFYKDIPYCDHSVIGKPEHLKNPSLEKLKEFYKTYYCANNMAVILCGDLDCEEAMDIVEEYFGRLRRNETLPERKKYTARKPAAAIETSVTDPSPERIYLGWTIPGFVDSTEQERLDRLKLFLGLTIMHNGDCGIMDDMVDTYHQALSAGVFIAPGADCSTLFMTAQPNEGQSMGELKEKLLEVVAELKKGDFEESRLDAAVNQMRMSMLEHRKENGYRAGLLLDSFVQDRCYAESVGTAEKLSTISKAEVIEAAERYFDDRWLYIEKHTGPLDKDTLEKPEITAIDLGEDRQSQFAREFLAMEPALAEPRFPDFSRDLKISRLRTGQKFIYRHNDDNSIFSLRFSSEIGLVRDKWLSLAPDYLNQLDTENMRAPEIRLALYSMASEVMMNAGYRRGSVGLSGMQENFGRTVDIASDWMTGAKNDEEAFRKLADARIAEERKKKDDFMTCQKKLFQYCTYEGESFVRDTTCTPEEFAAFSGKELLEHLKSFVASIDTVTYYGPAGEEEVKTYLESCPLVKAYDGKKREPTTFTCRSVTSAGTVFQDYDSPSAFILMQASWGEKVTPGEEAYYELLSCCLRTAINREVREARSLAYSSTGGYAMPFTRDEAVQLSTITFTQSSKVRECIETLENVCRNLPLSESMFSIVKEQNLAALRTRRVLDSEIIDDYLSESRLGYDHDHVEDIYHQIGGMTLEDLLSFHRSHLADHPFRFAVLGNLSNIDIDYLKSRGDAVELSKEDTFGY